MLEVVSSERGNQWPLSCYAPIRDRPVVPNLDDTSPEELRQLFHEAQKQGRVEDYINHARQLYNKAQDMRNFLKQPSAELGQLLVSEGLESWSYSRGSTFVISSHLSPVAIYFFFFFY